MDEDSVVGDPLPYGGTGRLSCQVLDNAIVLTDPVTGCTLRVPRGAGVLNWQTGLSEADQAGTAPFKLPGSIAAA